MPRFKRLAGLNARQVTVGTALFCLVLIAGFWLAAFLIAERDRVEIIEAEKLRNANLAIAFEAHTTRSLEKVTLILNAAARELRREGKQLKFNQLAVDMGIEPRLLQYFGFADEAGRLVDRSPTATAIDVSDREYFRHHQLTADKAIFISKPAKGRVTGQWTMHVTRRFDKPDGSFGGVVIAGLYPAYFTDFFQRADLGKGSVIVLTGFDGIVRSRKVENLTTFGDDLGKTPRWQKLLAERAQHPVGSYIAHGIVDGMRRIFSYRIFNDYPLIAAVGTSYEKVLAPANRAAQANYLAALIATLLTLGFGASVIILLRRHGADVATLADSEARLRAIFEQATVGIATTDIAGNYREVNRKFCDMLGYTAAELVGSNYLEFSKPGSVGDTATISERLLAGSLDNGNASGGHRFIHKDGRTVWVKFSTALVRGPTQDTSYFVNVLEDVSARWLAERQLKLLEKCVAKVNDIVIISEASPLDEPGPRIVYVNDAFERLTGYTREEVLGRSPRILQGPLTSRSERARIRAALTAGHNIRAEVINYAKDGRTYWLEIDIVPVIDEAGTLTHFAAVERDISVRKAAEANVGPIQRARKTLGLCNEVLLRADDEQALLKTICEIAVQTGGYKMAWIGYAMHDEARRIVPQADDGSAPGYLADLSLSWSADTEIGQGPAATTVRTGEPVVIADIASAPNFRPWLERAQSYGYAGVICLPLKYELTTIGVLALYMAEVREIGAEELRVMKEIADALGYGITMLRVREERQRTQEEIVKLNAGLEDHVLQRTTQLLNANKELEAFTYSVSHDLRAPLRAMDGFSQVLLADYSTALPADAQRLLGVIRRNATQMGQLIDDLLAFSRIGRGALELAPVDTNALVDSALDAALDLYPDRRHQVHIESLPRCEADAALLKQVWINLLSNALKFTGKSGAPQIHVGSTEINGNTVYFVRDNGAGFDTRYAHKLFDVFQRLHSVSDYPGTGVGLAIVQRVISRHGGRVWAESEIGRGSTFFFCLAESAQHE